MTIEGEGSVLVEISAKLPQEQHASSSVDGDFVIIEKFISFSIVLTWIMSIEF